MRKKKIKGGIHNPLISRKAHFDYEVVEQGDVKVVEYDDHGTVNSYPECSVLIKSLSGSEWSSDYYYCTMILNDALKKLRPGEIISADLNFQVQKDEHGEYKQRVTAENVYTLHDFVQIREAEAFYEGGLNKENSKCI